MTKETYFYLFVFGMTVFLLGMVASLPANLPVILFWVAGLLFCGWCLFNIFSTMK
jgi:hypothetical protein